MNLFRKARESDRDSFLKCLRRVNEALEGQGYQMEDRFERGLENESLFVLVDEKRILGAIEVSHSIADSFFPISRSYRKEEDLCEIFGYEGRPITIITSIFIDPSYQGKGLGTSLIRDIEGRYKANDLLVTLSEKQGYVLPFFDKTGFFLHCMKQLENPEGKSYFLSKKYIDSGLCRNIRW